MYWHLYLRHPKKDKEAGVAEGGKGQTVKG